MSDWKSSWLQVQKRLREDVPEFEASSKCRRVAYRQKDVKIERPKSTRALELLIKRLVQVCHPDDISQPPTAECLQRVRKARTRFGAAQSLRRTIREHPSLFVHSDLLNLLCEQRTLTAEELELWKNIKRPDSTQHWRKEIFLISLDALRNWNQEAKTLH